jgi:DHA1 family tetracycline resistance protein-like MFS transporter
MMIPVLPEIIREFVGGDFGRAAQLGGAIAAITAGLGFVCAPVMGALSDRYGRKPALILGMVGPGVIYFGLAMATSIVWLFAGFIVSGILGAIHTTTNAYVADVTPPEERASRYGMMGAAFGLGFIIGPLAGGLLGGIGLHAPLYAAGGLTLFNLALCLFLLPESLPAEKRRAFRWSRANPLASLGMLRRSPMVLALAVSLFLSGLANHGLYGTWVFSTSIRFDWGTAATGVTFAVMGVCAALSQGLLVGPAVKFLGERRSIIVGLAVGMLAFLAYAVAPQGWMIYVVIAVSSVAALDEPASQALLSSSVGEDEQGAMQGALASVLSLTGVIGPLIATNTFAYFVSPEAPAYFPGAPFASGAVLIAGALVLSWIFLRPRESVSESAPVEEPEIERTVSQAA